MGGRDGWTGGHVGENGENCTWTTIKKSKKKLKDGNICVVT